MGAVHCTPAGGLSRARPAPTVKKGATLGGLTPSAGSLNIQKFSQGSNGKLFPGAGRFPRPSRLNYRLYRKKHKNHG